MVKRCIGIDIGPSYLHAVQLLRTAGQYCVEKVFSIQTRRSTDSPSDILKTLVGKYGFDRRAGVAISMPHNSVFFRNLETDFTDAGQIGKLDNSALEHNFPIESEQIVAQVCSYRRLTDEKYSALTTAVARDSLRQRLTVLAEARMQPKLIDAAIFAIYSTVAVNHPEALSSRTVIVYIDEPYLILAVVENNRILIVRNISIAFGSDDDVESVRRQVAEVLSDELKITWQKVFGTDIEQDTKIYLAAGDNFSDDFETIVEENLGCRITVVNPYARVKRSPGCNGDAAICVAQGLALRRLAPEETIGINFIEADNADIKPTANLKKEFVVCAVLVAAIVMASLVGLFMRLSHLETRYARTKNEIREIFQHTLPGEKNIVNPLVQLDRKLQSLRRDYSLLGSQSRTGVGPLEILHTITTSVPPQANINISNMLITAESVRLIGSCRSFESVYNWQRLLQGIRQFSTVDVEDIRKESEGGLVNFTVLMSLATPQQAGILR